MKHYRFWGTWVFMIALLAFLTGPTLLIAENTVSTENTVSITSESDDNDEERTYVVHDEVFVEGDVIETPSANTVAAKLPLSLAETPLSIDSVETEILRQREPIVLGEALVGVSGLNIQSGNGIFDVFSLRGLDSSANGLILIDGAREPQSAFYQLYNVETVEVVKGPSSFLYGGAAMGGVINLVRKQPRPGNSFDLGVSSGTYGALQGTLDGNYFSADERWGFRFNSQFWQTNGFRNGKDAESYAVNPAFTFRPSERTTVNFNLEYLNTDAAPDSGLPLVFDGQGFQIPNIVPEQSYDAADSVSDQETYRFQVDVETRFSEKFLLRNKTYHRRFDWLSNATSLDGVFPLDPLSGGPQVVSRSQQTLDDEQQVTGNQLEALLKVETGGVTHNLLFGLELAQIEDQFAFTFGSLSFALLSNAMELGFPTVSPIFQFGTDAKSTVVAPYIVDQIHFSDKFQLLLGLRYDNIDFEDDLTGFKRDDSKTSPMIGAVFSPTPEISIYANAGQSFTPQSTFVVGEDRDPEEGEQIEAGLRYNRTDGKLSASLAAFQIDRDNVAIPDQTGVLRQTGSQSNEGIEFEITSELGQGLRATFNYTWIDAELTEFTQQSFFVDPLSGQFIPFTVDLSGNKAAWVPENIANLWLSKDFASGFGFAVGGRWVDEQFISENNAFAIDSFTKVDVVLWYGLGTWRLQANFDNVTDEETYTRVFSGNSVIPAPEATSRITFRYGFR